MGSGWLEESGRLCSVRWTEQGQQAHASGPHSGKLRFSMKARTNGQYKRVQMGCYQEGIAKDSVAGKDVTAHIFECVPTVFSVYALFEAMV